MENNKKSAGTIALVVLLLIVTIASLILATYAWAKYTTTESGNATANVAKWNVNFTENNTTFTGSYNHVADTKIAPGTDGSFEIQVNANSTETCFNYVLTVTDVQLVDGNTVLNDEDELVDGVTVSQVLSHIAIKDGSGNLLGQGNAANFTTLTGTYDLTGGTHNGTSGAFDNTTGTQTIQWVWPYQLETGTNEAKAAYDKIDTAAGKYAAETGHDLKLKISYSITATQINPANTIS